MKKPLLNFWTKTLNQNKCRFIIYYYIKEMDLYQEAAVYKVQLKLQGRTNIFFNE